MKGDIHFKGGAIFDLNFETYEINRFSWVPQIETVIMDNKDDDPQGGSEPAIITMGDALAMPSMMLSVQEYSSAP